MTKIAVIKQTLDELPFSDVMDWERYQTFCTDVISQKLGVIDCREYLSKGNKQDGIDVYAVTETDNKKIVAQCKLERYLSPKDVYDLVDEFIKGKFSSETKEFILCTSFDFKNHKDEETTIENARQKLHQKKINLLIWDKKGLSTYLRTNPLPHIVFHYFEEEITKAFYGEIWYKYINSLKSIPKQKYQAKEDYISRSVVPYIEYQKRENTFYWNFAENTNAKSLISLYDSSAIDKGQKIILLSIAGFGKSDELSQVAAFYSDEKKDTFPVRYFLKDYEGHSIETLLMNVNQDWKNIKTKDLLLLFDGLDEIGESYYQSFINHLNSFIENNVSVNVLVTSRFNFYDLKQQLLRNFDVYILQPISPQNIDAYMSDKLKSEKKLFKKRLEDNKFTEYLDNPYYLTRLVRFYANDKNSFPKNKASLFKRILFEQLDNDEAKFNISDELKDRLFSLSEKIAFCMTLSAKSVLTNDELKIIVPNENNRRSLRYFRILNVNASKTGSWSFEHKNLQEYLCASLLSRHSFECMRNLITFSFNRDKLLPRFLNTISFLFEILDNGSDLFKNVTNWLQVKQSELFIRFEKEQLTRENRQAIFKNIFTYYETRRITLRISSNFSILEMADFAEINEPIISFLGQKLKAEMADDTAYDALQLLSCCKKPFLYKLKLTEIYFWVLSNQTYVNYVKGQAIFALAFVDVQPKSIFDSILKCNVDINDLEIRKQLIRFLELTELYEDYVDFLFDSIDVYEKDEKQRNYLNRFDMLIRVILKFHTAKSIKRLLQYCISHPTVLSRTSKNYSFHFDVENTDQLLSKSADLYTTDNSILKIVYRLFSSSANFLYDDKFLKIFENFFSKTCGIEVVFKKKYKYDKTQRVFFEFANESCIDFLIKEYSEEKISDRDIIQFRNRLSWKNTLMMEYFMTKLNEVVGRKKLFENDDRTDYQKLSKTYDNKNQVMLLDKNAFLCEADEIFKVMEKEKIEYFDLHNDDNISLRKFRYSIVKEAINNCFIGQKESITYHEFSTLYSDDDYWIGYVIGEIKQYLQDKKSPPLTPELLHIASDWLTKSLIVTDFRNATFDMPDGSFTYTPRIEFIKELYMLVNIEVEDEVLLKMLQTDFSGAHTDGELYGVAVKVVSQVKDPVLLKNTIIRNVRSGNLSTAVLSTHFWLCSHLKYTECLADLYNAITTGKIKKHYECRKITDYYIQLGGDIADFVPFLRLPIAIQEEDYLISWDWYLIDKLRDIEQEKVTIILIRIFFDEAQRERNKMQAVVVLLQMGKIEGLRLWSMLIKKHHKLPFEREVNVTQKFSELNSHVEIVPILIDTLDYSFQNKIFATRSFDSIQQSIYSCLLTIATKSIAEYNEICSHVQNLVEKYTKEDFVQQIAIFLEQIHNRFYEQHEYAINIATSAATYNILSRF